MHIYLVFYSKHRKIYKNSTQYKIKFFIISSERFFWHKYEKSFLRGAEGSLRGAEGLFSSVVILPAILPLQACNTASCRPAILPAAGLQYCQLQACNTASCRPAVLPLQACSTATAGLQYCHCRPCSTATAGLQYCHCRPAVLPLQACNTATAGLQYCHCRPAVLPLQACIQPFRMMLS